MITAGLHLLPLPYFPGPAAVLRSLISVYRLVEFGALLGDAGAEGCRSDSSNGMDSFGDGVAPSSTVSAVGLIALAVWFPVTMLTASGISNTRASYLDVARTLGAGRLYLIFRVAIPAAVPNIFIGLFMGLGASFLTLVVAESVGVKSGLGWYLSWAQGWAEYGKVFAALIIMAGFFSTVMTLLFKLRDRVLVWQKGVIKW
jgi:NitT/TauT family transport system permease protein